MKLILALLSALALTTSAYAKDLVVVLSPHQSPQAAQTQVKAVLQYLSGLPPASTATILNGDSLQTVTRFAVPDGAAYRSIKARLKANRKAVTAMLGFARNAQPPHADTPPRIAQAVRLPHVLRHIANTRTAGAPLDVIVLGSPLYDDPREPEFSMAGGLVPSDGHLQTPRTKTPLGVGNPKALDHIRLHMGFSDESIFMTDQHRYFVERFWTLYLAAQGGALVTFTADMPTLFDRVTSGAPAPDMRFELEKTDKHDMVRLRRARMSQSLYERPISRTPLAAHALVQADNVEIGIRWDCSACDLDLYARPFPGAQVLFFGKTQTAQGEHVKDFQSAPSTPNGYETIFFTEPVDLQRLDVVVNFYKGSAPGGIVRGSLRLSANGRTYAHPFAIAARNGNRTGGVEKAFNTGISHSDQTLVIEPLEVIGTRRTTP